MISSYSFLHDFPPPLQFFCCCTPSFLFSSLIVLFLNFHLAVLKRKPEHHSGISHAGESNLAPSAYYSHTLPPPQLLVCFLKSLPIDFSKILPHPLPLQVSFTFVSVFHHFLPAFSFFFMVSLSLCLMSSHLISFLTSSSTWKGMGLVGSQRSQS